MGLQTYADSDGVARKKHQTLKALRRMLEGLRTSAVGAWMGRRPEGPGNEHRLKEEASESFLVGVEAECIAMMPVLRDIAGKHSSKEKCGGAAERGFVSWRQGQS